MPFSLLPSIYTDALTDLTPEFLAQQGIRLLMLDFDNTIVPYTTDTPTPQMEQWIKTMLDSDIQICVVSNSRRSRVQVFCKKQGIPCITDAKKPFNKGIYECMLHFSMLKSQCALVGDQIYTDVLGANCAGIRSILVKAINNHTIWLKLRHVAEIPFRQLAKKGRKLK